MYIVAETPGHLHQRFSQIIAEVHVPPQGRDCLDCWSLGLSPNGGSSRVRQKAEIPAGQVRRDLHI